LPIVIRTSDIGHYLLGRKLFQWEKTNFPVLDLSHEVPRLFYPMAAIPLPKDFTGGTEVTNDALQQNPDLELSSGFRGDDI
jgi:hypothetical protein